MKNKIYIVFFALVLILFAVQSLRNMMILPFSEFDEANRAEGARNMVKFSYPLAPVTGSPFFRRDELSFEYNKNSTVYIHLERNPLVFLTMGFFTKIFGDIELSYRLASFVFGLTTILLLFFMFKKQALLALLSLVPILFSYDWWLSLQMAHLDTALTFFMTVVLLLLLFGERIKNNWIFISIFIFLAFSSKGQMIIFLLTPLLMALYLRKISVKGFIKTVLFTFLLIVISLTPVFLRHGFKTWFDVYVMGIMSDRAVVSDLTQVAPMWWYGYWWMFSFRWGMLVFTPLVLYDVLNKKIDKNRLIILAYIVFNFVLMSLMKNKVWWYVMPLMPAICIYIYQSLLDKKKDKKLKNLFLIYFVSAIPFFWSIEISLKRVVAYVFLVIVINLLILLKKFNHRYVSWWKFGLVFLFLAFIFFKKFPKPSASFPEVKRLLEEVDLSNACLFVENMPYEGAMYYSKAGEINYWQGELRQNCQNYLISPEDNDFKMVKKVDRLSLYFISDKFFSLESVE